MRGQGATFTELDEVYPFGLPGEVTSNADGSVPYLSGWRTGMHVLEFDPSASLPEDRLVEVSLQQATFHASQVRIVSPGSLGRRLLLADNGVGFSIWRQ